MGQLSLHRRCPCFATELKRSVRPQKVVAAANNLKLVFQLFHAPGVTRRASR
jgi:hypothetical protein